MIRLSTALVVIACLSHTYAADPPLTKHSFISFGNPISQSPERLSSKWESLSPEKKKTILQYLMMDLGMSDTGAFHLIGVYKQPTEAHPKKVVFHFQQLDLDHLRSPRLFWSVLIDPDEQSAQLLYHVDDKREIGKTVSIAKPEAKKPQ